MSDKKNADANAVVAKTPREIWQTSQQMIDDIITKQAVQRKLWEQLQRSLAIRVLIDEKGLPGNPKSSYWTSAYTNSCRVKFRFTLVYENGQDNVVLEGDDISEELFKSLGRPEPTHRSRR